MPVDSLSVLITNITLKGRSGTEMVTRNVAIWLARRGHRPFVYSPELGPVADEIREFGIPVADDIASVTTQFDIIHGHHLPTTVTALIKFPNVPAIFYCHDFIAWHDKPPIFPAIRRYVAVSDTTYDRLIFNGGLPEDRVVLLPNAVDIERFPPGPDLPSNPRRALVMAKGRPYLAMVKEACDKTGILLDQAGLVVDRLLSRPENLMPQYDLVFASGMTAMEAIACGRAVIVCDQRGLGGMCTADNYDSFAARANFGLRTLKRPCSSEALYQEIQRYDAADAAECCKRIRAGHGMAAYIDRLVGIYQETISDFRQAPPSVEETAAAAATHLQLWSPRIGPGWPWVRERDTLLQLVDQLQHGIPALEIDRRYSFAVHDSQDWYGNASGFSANEQEGMWTKDSVARLKLRAPTGSAAPFSLVFNVHAFLPPARPSQSVTVTVGGIKCAELTFTTNHRLDLRFSISPEIIGPDGEIWLRFDIADPRSPAEFGLNSDDRRLGIMFHSVTATRIDDAE